MEILASALEQGIAPAIVIAIYLIIIKIIDNKRENAQIKLSSELTKSINTIKTFIVGLTKNVISNDREKCKNAIEDSVYSSGMRLINFVSNTIINNHIETNKDNIITNIKNIINAEYYTIYSSLSLYVIDDIKVSDCLNKEWFASIEQDIINIIYNDSLNKEDKIVAFNNKINIKLQTYITYINNHSLK